MEISLSGALDACTRWCFHHHNATAFAAWAIVFFFLFLVIKRGHEYAD